LILVSFRLFFILVGVIQRNVGETPCIDGKNMTNIFKIAIVNILFFCGLEGTKKKMTSAENRSHLLGLV